MIADSNAATLYAVAGVAPQADLLAVGHVSYELDALSGSPALPELERFAAEHGLRGAAAYVHFAGGGTIVHQLHLPPMKARQRRNAIRTRLTTYAAGRPLCVDEHCEPRKRDEQVTRVLAAGVDMVLARGLHGALRKAGLRVAAMSALAAACGPPAEQGDAVQLVLAERTTAIQLFSDGHLVFCRDILLGRADFVAAYQRPILGEDGPITLSPAQAEEFCREVGVPVGREGQTLGKVRADQIWPLIAPVLQKLRNETEQTLAQFWKQRPADIKVNVLCLPRLPGLGAYLAGELRLSGPLVPDERVEGECLTALCGGARGAVALDLAPPEARFVACMSTPALVAGICALLVMASNANAPRKAQAGMAPLKVAVESLQGQMDNVQARLSSAQGTHDELVATLSQNARLTRALPPNQPAIGISKALFVTVPQYVELLEAKLDVAGTQTAVELSGSYFGGQVPGVVAADWARRLAESDIFASAAVTSVTGAGHGERATIAIRATAK